MDHGYFEDYKRAGYPEEWLHTRAAAVLDGDMRPGDLKLNSFLHKGTKFDIWTLKIGTKDFRFFDTKSSGEACRVLHSLEQTHYALRIGQ